MTEQGLQRPAETVKSLLQQANYKGRFEEVLGRRAPQFMASISVASNSRALANAEPKSVIAAAFIAATLDLPIDKNLGFAHIVPYGGVAQFQMGYKGYIQLALRTGKYEAMNDFAVNKEAFVSFNPMTGDLKLDPEKLDEDSPNIVGYAFYFRLVGGFEKMTYWPKSKVESHAKRYSQAYRSGKQDSPWFTQFNAMALKTIISNTLRKYGILSVELQQALVNDQASRSDIDGEPVYLDGEEAKPAEGVTVSAPKIGATTGAPAEEAPKRKRRTKAEMEAARAAAQQPPQDGTQQPGEELPPDVPATDPAPDADRAKLLEGCANWERSKPITFGKVLKKEFGLEKNGDYTTLTNEQLSSLLSLMRASMNS